MAVATGIIVTFLATRTRFGRYVFAIGGNPEAAELAGIDTRASRFMVFVLMGVLCAVAGGDLTARLNAATNAPGTLDELYVIAAAVIGGTSLAGGDRHHRRRDAGGPGDAEPAERHGADGRRLALAEDGRRLGAGRGRLARHGLSTRLGVSDG